MRNEGNIVLHWYDIGVELLGNEDAVLDVIKENTADAKECCTKMFQTWLERNPDASWNQLYTTLEKIKLASAAFKIKSYSMLISLQILFYVYSYSANYIY